jgi:hypothetical protein
MIVACVPLLAAALAADVPSAFMSAKFLVVFRSATECTHHDIVHFETMADRIEIACVSAMEMPLAASDSITTRRKVAWCSSAALGVFVAAIVCERVPVWVSN